MPSSNAKPPRQARWPAWPAPPLAIPLVLLAALALGLILWGANALYQEREQRQRHQIERELQAISQLQARSVAEWRERRLSDAMALTDDTLFAQAVARWFATLGQEPDTDILGRLRILQERARYTAVYLVDPQGMLRLAPGDSAQGRLPDPELLALHNALAQAQPVMIEPRQADFFAFPFFSLMVPLFDGITPLGAVWLVSDVRTSLYPLLELWPTPSRSAESAIVQRDGNEVRFVSPLRHAYDAPQSLRLPMSRSEDPAVQAASGVRGVIYGRDYRGQDVLAMVSAVPDSPWFMVSKVDVAEAFTDMRVREWLTLSLPISLGLLIVGSFAVFWQRRAWRRERALKTELQRNMRWLESAQKAAAVGYFAYDAAKESFFMSGMACAIFGVPLQTALSRREWIGLLHPDERAQTLDVHTRAMTERTALRTQYRIRRASDRHVRWVEVWAEYDGNSEQSGQVRMIGTVQDITDRKQAEEKLATYRAALEAQVRQDPLTQVANRLALDEAVATEWSRALRSGAPLSVLMIDVDHFKAYNDHYGHVAGDLCLQRVAQALSLAVGRVGDMVARYGGEEFAVLLPDTDASQATIIGQRLCAAVRALRIEHLAAHDRQHITVSIGAASALPAFTTTPGLLHAGHPASARDAARHLFEQADSALYCAKQSGRDQVVTFAPDGQAPAVTPVPSSP
jgi:diguanylate cyclase (GGDEF)-like protein/PAS domain S-box-containing protein